MSKTKSFVDLMQRGSPEKEKAPDETEALDINVQHLDVTSAQQPRKIAMADSIDPRAGDKTHGYEEPFIAPAAPEEFELLEAQVHRQVARIISEAQHPLVTITRFASRKETAGKRHDVMWEKLCDVLANPDEFPSKESMPLLKFSQLPRNSRTTGTVPENMTAVVGDYDDEEVSVDEAVARLVNAGISAAVHTTGRHGHDAPRWRVVAQLATPVTPDEYAGYVDLLNGALGGILAPESWETTRSYFYGKVKGVEYQFASVPGVPIDLQAACGVDWAPIGKPGETAKGAASERAASALDDERDFERTITLSRVTDRTLHDLEFALEAIKDRAVARGSWNETFLAMVCFKGTEYEDRARALIEGWSQTHGLNWGVKEDDATKWDRENARDITYTSIFKWADEQDELQGALKTDESWRAKAKAAWHEKDVAALGGNIVPYTEFTRAMEPPSYIWHRVLQKGCL